MLAGEGTKYTAVKILQDRRLPAYNGRPPETLEKPGGQTGCCGTIGACDKNGDGCGNPGGT